MRIVFVILLTVLFSDGCWKPMPPPVTNPVSGKVQLANGTPITVGAVQFQSTTDRKVITVGNVNSDGSFTLTTLRDGRRAPGAMVGEYSVIYTPPLDNPWKLLPVTLPRKVTVVAGENQVTLTIPPPR